MTQQEGFSSLLLSHEGRAYPWGVWPVLVGGGALCLLEVTHPGCLTRFGISPAVGVALERVTAGEQKEDFPVQN